MDVNTLTDQQIVDAILSKDHSVTKAFLYVKCYPLFKSIFLKYQTDCEQCIEFINEIYLILLMPDRDDQTCKLSRFGYKCSLIFWLKIVAENYCHQLYKKKRDIFQEILPEGDRLHQQDYSLTVTISGINRYDIENLLDMMPNERYRNIIRFRYVEDKTNEEVASLLHMSMENYYNKHRLAKEQFKQILRKEGLI